MVAAFDFDGTLTRKDSFLEFVKFAKGRWGLCKGILLHAHVLAAYLFHLYPNGKAKQRLFAYFFKGLPLSEFDTLCRRFFQVKGKALLRETAVAAVGRCRSEGMRVVVVSASIANWVVPFGAALGADDVVGTLVEIDAGGKLTGHFLGRNCYGMEKVRRLSALFPDRAAYRLVAYGDSRGDKELLAYADEAYFRHFV